MKWRRFTEPAEGDVRRTRKFAFFPTRTSDGTVVWTVWLETYEFLERFDWFCGWRPLQRYPLFPQPGE